MKKLKSDLSEAKAPTPSVSVKTIPNRGAAPAITDQKKRQLDRSRIRKAKERNDLRKEALSLLDNGFEDIECLGTRTRLIVGIIALAMLVDLIIAFQVMA